MTYDNLPDFVKVVPPVEFVYATIAMIGGVARYLNGYVNGRGHFRWSMFFASAFVAGFSGWMFAIMGQQMGLPQSFVFAMAGSGGFFGEQTMKFIYEYSKGKVE